MITITNLTLYNDYYHTSVVEFKFTKHLFVYIKTNTDTTNVWISLTDASIIQKTQPFIIDR